MNGHRCCLFIACALLILFKAPLAAASTRTIQKQSSDVKEENSIDVPKNETATKRRAKQFTLFSVVQFPNDPCSSTSTRGTALSRNGTCFTNTECTSKSGTVSGSCASGFGVCCLFTVSTTGTGISQNCTYIQNPGFPTGYTTASAVTHTVTKIDNTVCYLRLDFDTFSLLGTGATTELSGGVCQDTFVVASSTGITYPTICGENAGQHIYIDMGTVSTDTATLTFNFLGTDTTTGRQWEIKASQIPCFSNTAPPECCFQYFTGLTGRFSTFNFIATADNHLASQRYSACIRQECGYCCIQYSTCADANSFTLYGSIATATYDSVCSYDYIAIPASSGTCASNAPLAMTNSRYCGAVFSTSLAATISGTVCDCTPPFTIDVFTNSLTDLNTAITVNTAVSRGVCLMYTQIPC